MSKSITAAVNVTPATVYFHGHALTVITGLAGEQLVAMKPICEAIGLGWQSQYNRIQRNQVLREGVVVMNTPSAGGEQETTCLPLDYLNGWLFGVDASRVRPEIRDTLIQYQRECFGVLAAYWQQGEAVNPRKGRKPKALPGAISVEQQQAIQVLVKARAEALPKEKQGKAVVRCWSALKSAFGCSYKEIDAEHYLDAVSLIASLPLEGELLEAEAPQVVGRLAIDYPLSWWDARKPGQALDSLDIAAADLPLGQLPLGEGSPCLRILDTLHAAGYTIDAAFYELRTYQNLMHRWSDSMRTVAFMSERIASSLRSDMRSPQRYSVNR